MSQGSGRNSSFFDNIGAALKANLLPAIILQIIALCIALSYFYWPATQPLFTFVAALRLEYGLRYAVISTAIFGGLLPFCLMYLRGGIKDQAPQQLLFYCGLWAFMGLLIAEFYVLQDYLFGSDNSVSTVLKKVAFDQFVFSVLITCPFITVMHIWKDSRFSWGKSKEQINQSLLSSKIPTTILTSWLVWIPAVCVIYSMPSELQIPLFNLVLCLFVLILALLNVQDEPAEEVRLNVQQYGE